MAEVDINGGICGFTTRVHVKKIDKDTIKVSIDTECPNIKKVAHLVDTVRPIKEIFCNLHQTEVYKKLLPGMVHPSCLVPSGVLKGIEIEAGLALPKDCYIKVTL